MRAIPIPIRKDNYSYLIIDDTVKEAAAVDLYTPSEVKETADQLGVRVIAGLTTHHHHDHSGGNNEFTQLFPGVWIYDGSQQSPALTQLVKGEDRFTLGNSLNVCIATPCHTQDSICFYGDDTSSSSSVPGVDFTGDTLFIAGCGVFFEGAGAEMHDAFERLAALPDATVTYVGHEYTAGNLRFARSVDSENAAVVRLGGLQGGIRCVARYDNG